MAESREAHVVDIPAAAEQDTSLSAALLQHHPLKEIAESPGHLLLLKLWQREEDLVCRRIGSSEAKLDSAKREVFLLCCLFFAFHGIFLTLLFTSSVSGGVGSGRCRDWWAPSCLSLITSLVLVCAVQVKVRGYWKVSRWLQRHRGDARALTRCVQELRMRGASFDLSKEPQLGKRMKSNSVEVKWRPLKLCSRNVVTLCMLCFTGLLFPASKFMLCW